MPPLLLPRTAGLLLLLPVVASLVPLRPVWASFSSLEEQLLLGSSSSEAAALRATAAGRRLLRAKPSSKPALTAAAITSLIMAGKSAVRRSIFSVARSIAARRLPGGLLGTRLIAGTTAGFCRRLPAAGSV